MSDEISKAIGDWLVSVDYKSFSWPSRTMDEIAAKEALSGCSYTDFYSKLSVHGVHYYEEHLDWVAPPVLPYYLSVFLFFIMKGERKERIPSAVDVALTLLENSTKAYSGAMSGATTFILSFLDWSSSHEGVSPGNKSLSLKLRQVYSAFG
jgi:hypothetical protein